MGNPHVIGNLVKALDENNDVGMMGASIIVPPDGNWFQKKACKEFPRYSAQVVDKVIESDMAAHPCCAMPKRVFEEVGGERENILRGLDPDLRYRIRQKGYKTALAPNTWVYHPLPDTLGRFIKTFIRNGMGSAYCIKHQPELIYDTDEEIEMKGFRPRVPFLLRIFRFPARIFKAVIEFKFLRAFAYIVYAFGFFYGLVKYSFEKIR
jgi:GT2 family glycosyltransferase